MKQILSSATAAEAGTIATEIPATTEPELGEPVPPQLEMEKAFIR
jgi:hypothetical protein